MSQKHHNGEKDGETKEEKTQFFVLPKHQSQEKWKSGMSGKEKVIAGKDAVKNFFIKERRSYDYMGWKDADVGKGNENRSYHSKNSDAFHGKRQVIGLSKSDEKTYKKKQH